MLRSYEPFWNNWYVDTLLGEGSFGTVYKIKREEFGTVQYAALKVISVPQSQSEVAQLESAGMSKEEVQSYYAGIVQEIYHEIAFLSELKGKSNIVSYEDHEIKERTGQVGYDIFIRMELLESLTDYMRDHNFSQPEVIHMGTDLCRALTICQKHNILHRDIKPDNIFISKDGDFKLGDFGIARTVEEYQMGLSVKGSYEYMAPEVYRGKEYDQRVDIYSLGVVLYTFLNKKRIPFLDQKNSNITYQERQDALKIRLAGEKIPMPCDAENELGKVILKAISYEKEERFDDAEQFLEALEQAGKCCIEMEKPKETLDLERTVVLHATPITIPPGLQKNVVTKQEKNEIVNHGTRNVTDAEKITKEQRETERIAAQQKNEKNKYVKKNKKFEKESLSISGNEKKNERRKKKFVCKKIVVAASAGIIAVVFFTTILARTSALKVEHTAKTGLKQEVTRVQPNDTAKSEKQELYEKNVIKKEKKSVVSPVPTYVPEEELLTLDLTAQKIITIEDSKEFAKIKGKEELLGTVQVSENQLKEILALNKAENLVSLDASGNQISNFSVLKEKKRMKFLNITGNPVSDCNWLSKMENLESLWIGGTKIRKLSGIENLSKLTDLHLEQTAIEDLSPLAECSGLTQIDLTGNKNIKNIDALLQLENLTFVSLDGTRVEDAQIHALYMHMKNTSQEFYLLDTTGREYRE